MSRSFLYALYPSRSQERLGCIALKKVKHQPSSSLEQGQRVEDASGRVSRNRIVQDLLSSRRSFSCQPKSNRKLLENSEHECDTLEIRLKRALVLLTSRLGVKS